MRVDVDLPNSIGSACVQSDLGEAKDTSENLFAVAAAGSGNDQNSHPVQA